MNDHTFTHKKEIWVFRMNFLTVFLLIIFLHPFYDLSAQEEDGRPADTVAMHALIRKLDNSSIPRTWEPLIPLVSNSQCANSDFSSGTFTNWSGCFGTWCAESGGTRCSGLYIPYNNPCSNLMNTWSNTPTGGHFSIQTPGTDPCIPAIQKVFPGDSYSALVGNRTCSSGGGGYIDPGLPLKSKIMLPEFCLIRFAAIMIFIREMASQYGRMDQVIICIKTGVPSGLTLVYYQD
jgi:hypothetical protein